MSRKFITYPVCAAIVCTGLQILLSELSMGLAHSNPVVLICLFIVTWPGFFLGEMLNLSLVTRYLLMFAVQMGYFGIISALIYFKRYFKCKELIQNNDKKGFVIK